MADAKTTTKTAAKTAAPVTEPKVEAPKAEEPKVETDQQKKNRLYSEAQRELRNRHTAEFTQIIEAKYAAEGLTYRRRLSEEEKAARQVNDLLAKHPGLRDVLVGAPVTEVPQD